MTRDEAITIWRKYGLAHSEAHFREKMRDDAVEELMAPIAESDIAGFVALGILKLDEPKSGLDVRQKFNSALRLCSTYRGGVDEVWHLLDIAGLKIIEK